MCESNLSICFCRTEFSHVLKINMYLYSMCGHVLYILVCVCVCSVILHRLVQLCLAWTDE